MTLDNVEIFEMGELVTINVEIESDDLEGILYLRGIFHSPSDLTQGLV